MTKLAKELILHGISRACAGLKTADISSSIYQQFFSGLGKKPGPVCKRALAYSLRITIVEYLADGKQIIWEPEFAGCRWTDKDNLNMHEEQCLILSEEQTSYILYAEGVQLTRIMKGNELIIKPEHEPCGVCQEPVLLDKKQIRLECGHLYHDEHIREHLSQQTNGYFVLTGEEEKILRVRCAVDRCYKPNISQEKIKEILGEEYAKYYERIKSQGAKRLIYVKCCDKIDANEFADKVKAIYNFADGINYSYYP